MSLLSIDLSHAYGQLDNELLIDKNNYRVWTNYMWFAWNFDGWDNG